MGCKIQKKESRDAWTVEENITARTVKENSIRQETDEQKRKKSKERQSRLESLSRSTASSRAKVRGNTPPPEKPTNQKQDSLSSTINQEDTSSKASCTFRSLPSTRLNPIKIQCANPSPFGMPPTGWDSDVYFFGEQDTRSKVMTVTDSNCSDGISDSSIFDSCISLASDVEMDDKHEDIGWGEYFGINGSFTCAFSFFAGVGLGIAIGMCGALTPPSP